MPDSQPKVKAGAQNKLSCFNKQDDLNLKTDKVFNITIRVKTAIFFMWRIEQRSGLDSVANTKLLDMKKN